MFALRSITAPCSLLWQRSMAGRARNASDMIKLSTPTRSSGPTSGCVFQSTAKSAQWLISPFLERGRVSGKFSFSLGTLFSPCIGLPFVISPAAATELSASSALYRIFSSEFGTHDFFVLFPSLLLKHLGIEVNSRRPRRTGVRKS